MNFDLLSYIYIPIIFIIGFSFAAKTARRINNSIVYLVFIEHILFSYLYYIFAQTNSADANMYYAKALLEESIISAYGSDTQFIIFITTFFVKIGFSKLATFFLFGQFGFFGMLYLIRMLDYSKISFFGLPMVFLVLLLPGFHFWTAAIGKDSIIFMLLMIFFYSLQQINKRFITLGFSIIFLGIIRPHMGFIIIFSIAISLFLRNPLKYRASHLVGGFVSIIIVFASLPFIASFLSIDQLELNDINQRLEFYSEYGANKTDDLSSYVDVSSYSLPMKMFAYLFRPLFFDAHSILQILASFENLFLFILIFKWLKSIKFKIKKWYKYIIETDKIMTMYLFIGWIVLAASMYNLGLASRQKYMLLPILFILVFRDLNKNKQNLS